MRPWPNRRAAGSASRTGSALLVGLLVTACGEAAPASSAPRRPTMAAELRPAAAAIDARRFEEARRIAQAYLGEHAHDPQALFLIGLSHAYADNHGAARPFLEQTLARAPDFDLAWEPLARTRFLLGDLAGARAAWTSYAERAPADPKGPHGLGLVALEETRLDEAEAHFRRALACFDALEPRQAAARAGERSESHARLGEVRLAAGDLAGARAELLRAIELSDGNLSALYTLGLVHRRLGEEALADAVAARYERARAARLAPQGTAPR